MVFVMMNNCHLGCIAICVCATSVFEVFRSDGPNIPCSVGWSERTEYGAPSIAALATVHFEHCSSKYCVFQVLFISSEYSLFILSTIASSAGWSVIEYCSFRLLVVVEGFVCTWS